MDRRSVVFVNATGVRSGAENVAIRVAETLAGPGVRITLVSPEGPVADSFPGGTVHDAVEPMGLQGSAGAARVLAVARVARAWVRAARVLRRAVGPDDLVVVNSLFALPILPVAFPLGRRGGLTTWLVHDTVVSRKQRVAVRLGARHIDRAVAVSEVTAGTVRPLVREVVVRPNGVEVSDDRTHTGGTHTGGTRAGGTGRIVVGILAALTPWKGQDVVLEAVARVPGLLLEVAGGELPGESGYAASLRARAERPDLRGRVRFLGHVDRSEVLPRWTVAVSASVLPEAGPLGVLEAMAAGVPVVATAHGGAAEYVAHGAGVLVPPGDADALALILRRMTLDPDMRAGIARAARARVEREYDLRRTLPAMVEALTRR